jgi:phenylalanyl-tRNA synthetase alpha chain
MIDDAAIARLREAFTAELAAVSSPADLQALRDKYLGRRQGVVTSLLADLKNAPPDARRELGRLANDLKAHVTTALEERRESVSAAVLAQPGLDFTLPGRPIPIGHRHPLEALRARVERIFACMGYEVLDGPEAEDDYHNFEALNMPSDHPARDMQDTLYLASPLGQASLLRTHTSPMQIRYMETHTPPVRIIAPGRVYRRDSLDPSHTPMFHQVEGLVVGDGVTMADLKGTLLGFLRQLFHPDTPVILRPSFFPYTEPSAEVIAGCPKCEGRGCSTCKGTGWLEMGGSGMVHPAVFEAVGYDPERYTGFAFGMGLERIAMVMHGIEDIRLFYENDLRFLEQFPS